MSSSLLFLIQRMFSTSVSIALCKYTKIFFANFFSISFFTIFLLVVFLICLIHFRFKLIWSYFQIFQILVEILHWVSVITFMILVHFKIMLLMAWKNESYQKWSNTLNSFWVLQWLITKNLEMRNFQKL